MRLRALLPTVWGLAVLMSMVGSLAGCGDARRPLDMKTLGSVILDLHLLEARRELVADAHPDLRDSILAVHGVTHAQFEAAIRYYADRPEEYLVLYNQVIDSLSAEEAALEEAGVLSTFPPP